MISEKKLAYYEHVADNTCSEECQKIITQLVSEVRKLEREADWLATQLAKFDTCPNDMLEKDVDCFLRCERHMYTKPCWREYAREAVQND